MAGRRASFSALFGLLAVMPTSVSADPPEMHNYVTIAGIEYLVVTLSGQVRVIGDPAPARASPEARGPMLGAVREATGCRIADDRWDGVALHGRLDCTDRLPFKIR